MYLFYNQGAKSYLSACSYAQKLVFDFKNFITYKQAWRLYQQKTGTLYITDCFKVERRYDAKKSSLRKKEEKISDESYRKTLTKVSSELRISPVYRRLSTGEIF